MEEKARLSREQEMQQQYKSQPALQISSSSVATTSGTTVPTTKTSVRDLSSTLLNTSMPLPPAGAVGSSAMLPGTVSSVSWGPSGTASSESWNKPTMKSSTMDMSALDNIMPMGSKTRPTLNSMVQPVPPAPGPNPFGPTSSMMQPIAFPQPSLMMPGVSNQMGIPPSFGAVRPMMPGNSTAMGGISLLGPQQPGIPQSSQQSSGNTTSTLSNKDIADLLGWFFWWCEHYWFFRDCNYVPKTKLLLLLLLFSVHFCMLCILELKCNLFSCLWPWIWPESCQIFQDVMLPNTSKKLLNSYLLCVL